MAPINFEPDRPILDSQAVPVLSVLIVSAVAALTFLITLLICSCCGEDDKNNDVRQHQTGKSTKAMEVNIDCAEGSPEAEETGLLEAKKAAAVAIDSNKSSPADQAAQSDKKRPSVKAPSDGKAANKSFVGKTPLGAVSNQTEIKHRSRGSTIDLSQTKTQSKSTTGTKLNHFMGGNCLSTARNDMNAPVVIPATSKHTATVIFMHGLGDTGHGWAPVFQMIRSPHVKYICPTALTIPVTLNMGMQMPSWFDIKGLSINADEDEPGIKKATTAVHSWIDEEVKSGIPSDRIILGGFSQGGGLALYSALTYDKPLAGVIGLSCWLPLHKQIPGSHQANKNVPILQCHGDSDPLVIVQVGQLTAKMLQGFNSNHTLKIYPGMGHSSCDQEIQDIKHFVEQRLPPK